MSKRRLAERKAKFKETAKWMLFILLVGFVLKAIVYDGYRLQLTNQSKAEQVCPK